MGSDGGVCNTGLGLGLDQTASTMINKSSDHLHDQDQNKMKKKLSLRYDHLLPSDLTLGPSDHHHHHHDQTADDHPQNIKSSSELNRRASSDLTSFSNSSSTTVKRIDREIEEVDIERVISTTTAAADQLLEDIDQEGSPRKKLRLTKQQSALLEDSFKDHTTLNPKQKQDLARQLNLRPRQVEVWFQNRRARTKLKQTEADYEHLKKCCETLTEENKRLQKELQELKSLMKLTAAPLFMQFPTSTTLTICPSCERICSAGGSHGGGSNSTGSFLIGPKTHHFSNNPFTTNPSAAC